LKLTCLGFNCYNGSSLHARDEIAAAIVLAVLRLTYKKIPDDLICQSSVGWRAVLATSFAFFGDKGIVSRMINWMLLAMGSLLTLGPAMGLSSADGLRPWLANLKPLIKFSPKLRPGAAGGTPLQLWATRSKLPQLVRTKQF